MRSCISPVHYAYVVLVTNSSLKQLTLSCKNLTQLDLSHTTLIHDMIVETGEYISTLQHSTIQPDLTQVPITRESVIKLLRNECSHLKDISVPRCDWITTKLIWLIAIHCHNLERLDAQQSDNTWLSRNFRLIYWKNLPLGNSNNN